MGIEAMFTKGDIINPVAEFQRRVEEAFVLLLKWLGEKLAAYAKAQHNYTDRSGNLTNSIGYAITKRSSIIYYSGKDQPGEGSKAMLEAAMTFASQLKESYSLIVVSGMDYAAYVESKGYNVILPAELLAKRIVPTEINKLVSKANKKAKELFDL